MLHDVALSESVLTVSTSSEIIVMGETGHSSRVMLKVVPVRIQNWKKLLDTYAVLDDGSERTIIMQDAAHQLGLVGNTETLSLRTIRHEVVQPKGTSVSFTVSPTANKGQKISIQHAFTAAGLTLAEQSHSMDDPTKRYKYFKEIPLRSFHKMQFTVLISSDNPHLIVPTVCASSVGCLV